MTESIRVLLVEDTASDQLIMRDLLEQSGITDVTVAERLRDAVEAVERERFDVILLDLRLPDSTGISTFVRMQSAVGDVPILIDTIVDDLDMALHAVKLGAEDYLIKPAIETRSLLRAMHYAIERKRSRMQLVETLERERRAKEEAEAANRAKDQFIMTASHELRTPMNSINGWVDILLAKDVSDEQRRFALGVIKRSVVALDQLISDLLDMSRIATGKLQLHARPLNLVWVIESALEKVQLAAEAKGIALERDLDAAVGLVTGDAARLQQVIWNLLANAIKFTPEGGRVEISLDRTRHHARVRVADSGVGISPEFLPHVFERFRQDDAAKKSENRGLGLGLAIVQHLVEMHGGTVSATSEGTGLGATFSVEIPLVVTAEESVEREDSTTAGGTLERRLDGLEILVVDDEEDQRVLLASILERGGARVTTAESVAEAVELYRVSHPDVVVSDLAFPVEDGCALVEKIHALAANDGGSVRAVAVTSYSGAEIERRLFDAGFRLHLVKPVGAAALISAVAEVARGPVA